MARNREGYTIKIAAALNGLTYTVGLISFLSVVRYVGIIFSLSFVCLLVTAFYFDYRRRYAISRGILNSVLVVFVALNSFRITLDDFATPVVEMILILTAVKFIEEKQTRDYMQIYALATFLLAGSALLTLDMQFLVNLIMLMFLLPLCIVLLTFYSQNREMTLTNNELSRIVSKALLIPLVSIPMTALMFVILPRTGYPLLNFLNRGGASVGFTDNVKLGEIANIQENAAVILRVESEKIDERMLYWRGIVLDYFDGTSWKSMNKEQTRRGHFGVSGKKVSQIVYLEPYENKYLFALDKPTAVYYRDAVVSEDLIVALRQNIDRRVKYNAVSVLSGVIAQENIDRTRYLQLPGRDFGKVEAIIKELYPGKSKEALTMAVLHHLKEGEYSYSLKKLPVTDHPLEDFLFTYKYGNCEYFASAMAVMLRLAGVPARLVGGYRGGFYNDFGGYYLVTQNSAHVWVEAYLEGKGWVRMDPTPGGTGAGGPGQMSFFFKLRLFLDSINYYWNAMIIGYDLNKQMSLFVQFRNMVQRPSFNLEAIKRYGPHFTAFIFIIAAGGAALYLLVIRRKSPERALIDNFLKKMKKHGFERVPSEGLEEFVGRIADPQLKEKAYRFVAEFEDRYYRDKAISGEDMAFLGRLLDDL